MTSTKQTIKNLFILIFIFILLPLAAQDALIIAPGGNVGINTDTPQETLDVNGNLNVNGDINFTGTLMANNLPISLIKEMVLISSDSTKINYPVQGTTIDINFPPRFTPDNSFVIMMKVQVTSGTWYQAPRYMQEGSDKGFINWYFSSENKIKLENNHYTAAFNDQKWEMILARY